MNELIRFLIAIGIIAAIAFLPGCTYTIVHEWDGENIPITVDYPEYIVVSGNIGNTTYNVTVE